jgi:ADP-heptose:LPS heptosyltransferase
MANDSTTGRWKRAAFKLLGPARGRKVLSDAVRKLTEQVPAFSFPLDPARVGNVLIILPSEKLQVLHQLRNIIELVSFFKQAKITLLAETSSAPLAGLIEGITVIEYPFESKKLFSAAFNGFTGQFKGSFDICCLLTPDEDLVLLNCAGRTAAPVRIGYTGAGGPPFLNVHVNPSLERVLASDWNCAMAEMLGAKKILNAKWAIAKQTAREIDHLLKEHHIDALARPTGVDALFFRQSYGAWADDCLAALLPVIKNNCYLYAEETHNQSELTWLAHFDLPVLANLSIPQSAALAARSGLIITGNTLLFGLAALLAVRVIGVFKNNELAANCPQSPEAKGIAYEQSPGKETIEKMAAAMTELLRIPGIQSFSVRAPCF